MAVLSSLTISGYKSGLPGGSEFIGPLGLINPASTGAVSDLTLASGLNTIAVPSATALGVVIVPPQAGTVALTLKGASGDTGVPLNPGLPTLLTFPTGTANLLIVAASQVAVELVWF